MKFPPFDATKKPFKSYTFPTLNTLKIPIKRHSFTTLNTLKRPLKTYSFYTLEKFKKLRKRHTLPFATRKRNNEEYIMEPLITRKVESKTYPQELVQRLVSATPSLIRGRLLADYGAYLSKGPYGASQHVLAVKVHREIYPLELEYIAGQIALEQRQNPWLNASLPLPETPFMNAVARAAQHFSDLAPEQLACEIEQAVQRDQSRCSGARALVAEGDWMGLACRIMRDRVQLRRLPHGDGMIWEGEVGAWEEAVERCAADWFEMCCVKPSGVKWALPRWEKWEEGLSCGGKVGDE